MNSHFSPRRLFATAAAIPLLAGNVILLLAGHMGLSLFDFAVATTLFAGLYLLFVYYLYISLRGNFDDWMNHDGGPKGPHPLPTNDAHLLNQRHRTS